MKNYGIDLAREAAELQDSDFIGGTDSPKCLALIPLSDRVKYLPIGEVQKGKEDFMDCATRAPINKVEAKFTFLYQNGLFTPEERKFLEDYDYVDDGRVTFSDRFIAMKSGTNRYGNSLKAPCHAMHQHGLIPKKMLPANKKMTWDQYHDRKAITPDMEEVAALFRSYFTIYYERVLEHDFPRVISEDMISVAGYAWPTPDKKGVYQKDDRPINHAWLYFELPRFRCFDNYIDSFDKDFIKVLAPNYILLDYGYRLFIERSTATLERITLDQMIKALFRGDIAKVFSLIAKKIGSWRS